MKKLIAICLIVGVAGLLVVSAAISQPDTKAVLQDVKTQRITLELMDTPIRSALESLFKGTGLNYVLDENVVGIVRSVNLKDIPFDQALKILLKTVDPPLVYKKDGDVYLITKKKEQPVDVNPQPIIDVPPTSDTEKAEDVSLEKIPLNFIDAYDLKAMIEGGTNDRNFGGAGGMSGTSGMSGMGSMGSGMSGMGSGMSGFGSGSSSFGSGSNSFGSSGSYGSGGTSGGGGFGISGGYGGVRTGY